MRLDLYLSENGLAESRNRAQSLIKFGNVYADGRPVTKPSFEVNGEKSEIRGETLKYVSRGGLKLEAALDTFGIDVKDMTAVDFGASAGGFTDCLLQRGAGHVTAIDSGTNQLHPKLKNDKRVTSLENTNARYLTSVDTGGRADIAVMDVSFISQTKLYEAVVSVLKEGGAFVSLIKPQFEAGREYLNKNGIIRDEKVHKRVIESIKNEAEKYGLICRGIIESPVTGGDGNREYLAYFIFKARKDEQS